MYADTFEEHPLNGCKFPETPAATPELRGSPTSPNSMPRRVDLRNWCTAVENQGHTNSCVANALVGALELLARKDSREATDLSRMFLYYNARKIGGMEQMDDGTLVNHAMAALLAYGICEERMWPFMHSAVNQEPTQACYSNATHYKAVKIARTPNKLMLTALANELPVSFAIVLPAECYGIGKDSGACPAPETLPMQSPAGGHAMLAVGYDLDQQTYLVRNSWGAGFGDGGYWTIPFAVMERYAIADQYFTIGQIEAAPGLEIFGETVVPGTARMVAAATNQPPPTGNPAQDPGAGLRNELEGRLDRAKKGFASRLRGN